MNPVANRGAISRAFETRAKRGSEKTRNGNHRRDYRPEIDQEEGAHPIDISLMPPSGNWIRDMTGRNRPANAGAVFLACRGFQQWPELPANG